MVKVYRAANASWYGVALLYHYPQGLLSETTEPCYNRATAEYLGRKLLATMQARLNHAEAHHRL